MGSKETVTWTDQAGRMVRATNSNEMSDEDLRRAFALQYTTLLYGRTIAAALRLWRARGNTGPLLPPGTWRLSGGTAKRPLIGE